MMTRDQMILWSALAIVIAAVATFLINKLLGLVSRTLPQWDRKEAETRFAKMYPGKSLQQVLEYFEQRDKAFSRMVDFLPVQCFAGLLILSALWAWAVPPTKSFWLSLVQNLFLFEVTLLAMIPAFRILRSMQKLVISRLREIVKK